MSETTGPRVRPADRYGDAPRRGRRAVSVAAIALCCGAVLVFLLWVAVHQSTPAVRAGLVAYDDITDTSVTVRFEVVKDPRATVICRLRARSADNVSVGSAEVEVGPPAHLGRSVVEAVVRTSERPVNGEVQGCEPA